MSLIDTAKIQPQKRKVKFSGKKFCNLSSHRESRWLLCSLTYGVRVGRLVCTPASIVIPDGYSVGQPMA